MGKPVGNLSLVRLRMRLEDNINIDLVETGCEDGRFN
jgi:hypothetical protein